MIRVNEIFHSIQGESGWVGWPCVFVRLTGCNLRCRFCDTQYAYHEGMEMSVSEISGKVRAYACPLVEITGGEPLIQPGTPGLVAALLDQGCRVLLETNGSCDISLTDPRCVRIVDFKCPSSGESEANDYANIDRLEAHDEVKFVLSNREDYEFAKEILGKVQAAGRGGPVHFSPVFGLLAPKTLVEWILRDGLNVRLNLQLHKIIWGPDERGV